LAGKTRKVSQTFNFIFPVTKTRKKMSSEIKKHQALMLYLFSEKFWLMAMSSDLIAPKSNVELLTF